MSYFYNPGGRTAAYTLAGSACKCEPGPGPETSFLPSANSANRLVHGEPGAFLSVTRDVLLRSGLIGLGLYVAGDRDKIVKKSLIASVTIEVAVLLLAWCSKGNP